MSSHSERSERASAIELQDVSKSFGKNQVLADLSLTIAPGERFVLLGPSGCGKSTLVRLIAGLEQPTRGRVLLSGRDQVRIPAHMRPIAVMLQHGGCYEHLSCEENIRLGSQLPTPSHSDLGPDPSIAWPAAKGPEFNRWLVDRLELQDVLSKRPTELSGGQFKRLALARALASQRPILLLDEPFAHLNDTLRQRIKALLLDLHRQARMTLLFVTHDSVEAMQMADRAAVIDSGAVQQVGTPEQLYHAPQSKTVAMSLGVPHIEFFVLSPGSLALGVRPSDWQLVRTIDHAHAENISTPGLSESADGVHWIAHVEHCQFMGNQWWLMVRSSGGTTHPYRGTVAISQKDFNPQLLRENMLVELFVRRQDIYRCD